MGRTKKQQSMIHETLEFVKNASNWLDSDQRTWIAQSALDASRCKVCGVIGLSTKNPEEKQHLQITELLILHLNKSDYKVVKYESLLMIIAHALSRFQQLIDKRFFDQAIEALTFHLESQNESKKFDRVDICALYEELSAVVALTMGSFAIQNCFEKKFKLLMEEPEQEPKMEPVSSFVDTNLLKFDEETGFAPYYEKDALLDGKSHSKEFIQALYYRHPLRSVALSKETLEFCLKWSTTFYMSSDEMHSELVGRKLTRHEIECVAEGVTDILQCSF